MEGTEQKIRVMYRHVIAALWMCGVVLAGVPGEARQAGLQSANSAAQNVALLEAQVAQGAKVIELPPGRFVLNRQIKIPYAPVTLKGAGAEATVLVWGKEAGSSGIAVTPGAGQYGVMVRDLSLHTAEAGRGTALRVDMTAQTASGLIQNRTTPRLTLDNVHAHGATNPAQDGWHTGLELVNVLKLVVNNFSFVGKRLGPGVYASAAAVTSSGLGAPAEQMFTNISVVAADVGLAFDRVEGIFVAHSNLVDVGTGVRARTGLDAEPMLQVHNSHINTNRFGIFADGMAQMNLHHLLIYARNSARRDVVGIHAVNAVFSSISDNIFVDNSTRHALDGIVLEGDGNLISGNLFQSARRAIWIKGGKANRIGLQVFGKVDELVLDHGIGTVRAKGD